MVKQGWLHRGKGVSRPDSFDVAYDPAVADVVYLLPKKNSSEYWVCSLTERSREFRGCSFWDVWQTTAKQKAAIAESRLVSDQKRRELENFIESKIKFAQSQSAETDGLSNAERISAIRRNRQEAKERERQQATNILKPNAKKEPAEVIPLTKQPDDYSYPSFIDELFEDD
jgi:ATPase subunit of ABC transporter with duplicated ATPase domains